MSVAVSLLFAAFLMGSLAGVFWLRHRFLVVTVWGDSMAPTLSAGQRLLVRRCALHDAKRDALVVFVVPPSQALAASQSGFAIKRLVAMSGGSTPVAIEGLCQGETVPPGYFVVLGDNAESSFDSRLIGPIDKTLFVGTVQRALGPTKATQPGNVVAHAPPRVAP